jgi:hypothetical protein
MLSFSYASMAAAVGIVVVCVAAGHLIHVVLRTRFSRLAEETRHPVGNVLAWSLRYSLPFWFLLGGVYVASAILGVGPAERRVLNRLLLGGFIISTTIWVANLGARFLRLRVSAGAPASSATGVVRNVLKIAVFILALLCRTRSFAASGGVEGEEGRACA